MNRFLTILVDGKQYLKTAIASSRGSVDKDSLVATGASGKLDISLMPAGLDISAETMTAGEAISAGDFVNIFNDGGARKVRLADAANNRPAHGFVLANISNAATGTIYTSGINSSLGNLTPGEKYFLGIVPGKIRKDLSASAAIAIKSGEFIQTLGTAISTNTIRFEFDEPIYVD